MTFSNVYKFPTFDVMLKAYEERKATGRGIFSDYIIIEAGAITDGNRPSADVFDFAEEAAKRKS